jgi:hypothetical protein
MTASDQHRLRRPNWLYRWMNVLFGPLNHWLHMSCRSFIRRASDKYERPLGRGERVLQAMHRAMCRLCRIQERRMDQLHTLAREIGRDAGDDAEVELSPEARGRMRTAMQEAEARGR